MCRICNSEPFFVGHVFGAYRERNFALHRCVECGYAFIADPWLEFEQIYDERYYAGAGADPLVDYFFELEHPELTVRQYEWHGVARILKRLLGGRKPLHSLDYGCGNGGLVRYLRDHMGVAAVGFEEGHIADRARARGIPIIERGELAERCGQFDAVTAIEVLEHTLDPLAELRAIRSLLRPGGLLFLTTGNAQPFAERLHRWRYVVPEIHISFFEPRTLATALRRTGFIPDELAPSSGFDEILKFKVLKNMHVRRRTPFTDLLPARMARTADRRVRLSAHPIGWAE
jgi:SAM-dependent methyltransferase